MQFVYRYKTGFKLLLLLSFLALSACTTPPARRVETPEEKVQRANTWGQKLSQQLESQLKIKHDKDVEVYLRALANQLSATLPTIKDASLGTWVVQDRTKVWKNYSLPGNRIYLSAGLLQSLEYENELAAAIAIELGHLVNQDVLKQLETLSAKTAASGLPEKIDFFGPAGLLTYSNASELEAARIAVDALYRAGYDPRGMIGLLNKFEKNPSRSPYDQGTLRRLVENTRQEISQRAPLRNPVVRSQEFLAIQKKIRRLK